MLPVGSPRNGYRSARARRASSQSLTTAVASAIGGQRFDLETLERRALMDATGATVALDPAFGQAGAASPAAPGHAVGSAGYDHLTPAGDGKFYAIANGGRAMFPFGATSFELLRLNGDGSLDPTFGDGGAAHVDVYNPHDAYSSGGLIHFDYDSLNVGDVIVQPDGKLLLTVQDQPQYSPDPWLIMRLNADGSPDATFGSGGREILPYEGLPHAWLRPDGKIDVLQSFGGRDANQVPYDFALVQLNADGSADASFGNAGEDDVSVVPHAAWVLDPSGYWYDPPPGDQSSDSYAAIGGTALDGGGSAVYVTDFSLSDDRSTQNLSVVRVELDAVGNVVTKAPVYQADARPYAGYYDDYAISFAVQPDGKALLLDGADGKLARFNADGTPDASFGNGGVVDDVLPDGYTGTATGLTVGADGKVVVTLTFVENDYTEYYQFGGVERFNPDGSRDATFAGGQAVFGFGDDQRVSAAVTLPDGSVLAGVADGNPTWWYDPGTTVVAPRIVKLTPAGGAPGTFDYKAVLLAHQPPPPPPPVDNSGGDTTDDGSDGSYVDDGSGDSTGDYSGNTSGDGTDTLVGDGYDDGYSYDDPGFLNDGGGGASSVNSTDDQQGFFDSPTDATLFNPDGTPMVFQEVN